MRSQKFGINAQYIYPMGDVVSFRTRGTTSELGRRERAPQDNAGDNTIEFLLFCISFSPAAYG